MKVTIENLGTVLQHIYDSEIHLEMGWCWDGGLSYRFSGLYPLENFNPSGHGEIQHTGEADMAKALQYVVDDILKMGESGFSKWWNALSPSTSSAGGAERTNKI